jgi:hypothetical protein
MSKRTALLVGIAAVVSSIGIGTAGYAVGVAAAPSVITAKTTDAVVTTTAQTALNATPATLQVIASLSLPKGHWVLHADNSAVANGTATDFVRCQLVSGSTELVQNSTNIGSSSGLPLVAQVTETAAVSLTSTTVVEDACEHDGTNGATDYIDPGATLWAHKAASLVATTTP